MGEANKATKLLTCSGWQSSFDWSGVQRQQTARLLGVSELEALCVHDYRLSLSIYVVHTVVQSLASGLR